MFCPSCGRQNQENVVFCSFCGKALPQKSSTSPVVQSSIQPNLEKTTVLAKKPRLSFTAIKAIITVALIAGLVIAVLLSYYPGIFS